MQDAEETDDDEEEVDKIGDDEAPDRAEKVEYETLEHDQQLQDDDRRQKTTRAATRILLSGSLGIYKNSKILEWRIKFSSSVLVFQSFYLQSFYLHCIVP